MNSRESAMSRAFPYPEVANPPDRANRRQPLGFREPGSERSVIGLQAAVAHLDC